MDTADLNVHDLDQFKLLTYLADASFRETALLHDALVLAADECMNRDDAGERDPDGFNRYSRMSHVASAAMRLEWPEATAAWLGG